MTTNLDFLYNDRVATAAVTTVSEELSWPVANVQTPRRKQAWRSIAGVTSTYILIDFGAAVTCGACIILASNLGASGTYRVRHGSVPDMTSGVVYDSTVRTAEGDTTYPDHCVWWANTTARYLRIDLSDATKPYLSVGRIIAGPSWKTIAGHGSSISYSDSSTIAEARSGEEQRDLLPTIRLVSLSVDYVTDASARSDLLEAARVLGLSRDGAWYVSGWTGRMGRDLVVGRLTSVIEAEAFDYAAWRCKLQIRETL